MADVQDPDMQDDFPEDADSFDRWRSPSPIVWYNSNEPVSSLSEPPKPKRIKSESKKKHKKSKKEKTSRSQITASETHVEVTTSAPLLEKPEPMIIDETTPSYHLTQEAIVDDAEPTVSPSTTKKKRKHSDSVDGKRSKKKRSRSHHHDLIDEQPDSSDRHQEQEQAVENVEVAAADFLIEGAPSAAVDGSAIEVEEVAEHDSQQSPEVTPTPRRSPSHEARSRETDVSLAAVESLEALAHEAWNGHQNSQLSLAGVEHAAEAPTPEPTQPPSSPGRRRSTRKKAKPTFFEQPPVELSGQNDEPGGGASPTDATPKRRSRGEKASKKTGKGKKPTKEQEPSPPPTQVVSDEDQVEGGDEEIYQEAYRPRRNRLSNYRQGRFSEEELARIAKAVESFRAENDMTKEQVNQMIHEPGGTTAGERNAQLWLRIFAECPDRHRQKVINITRKKNHNFVARGTWTPDQDAELSALINVHGRKWSKIAAIINRHPEDLRDRYRNYLVCGENQRKDVWSEDEEARLTKFVIESMEEIDKLRITEPNVHLETSSYEEIIDWQLISEKMDRTRSRLQCITKWKSLNLRTHGKDKLISGEPGTQITFGLEKARRQIAAMPDEEKYRLVLAIHSKAVSKDSRIPWQKLNDKQFRNAWHRPTLVLYWHRLRGAVPGGANMSTRDLAQYLVDEYNRTGELPDVSGGGFDDVDEADLIGKVPTLTVGATSALAQEEDPVGSDSDAEDGGHVANVNGAETHDEDFSHLQGYPALEEEGHQDLQDQQMPDEQQVPAMPEAPDVPEASEAPQEQELPEADDIQIDPALVKTPTKKAPSAKRTGSGKPPAWKKTKKAPVASMDPVEDIEASQE